MEALDELIRLNRIRWRMGKNWEPFYAFMRANTPNLRAQGDVRFSTLTLEGRVAALDYQVRKGNRSFMIMANFHPDFAELSPGNLLMHWTTEQLQHEGTRGVRMEANRLRREGGDGPNPSRLEPTRDGTHGVAQEDLTL